LLAFKANKKKKADKGLWHLNKVLLYQYLLCQLKYIHDTIWRSFHGRPFPY